jgi:hypothetical protein
MNNIHAIIYYCLKKIHKIVLKIELLVESCAWQIRRRRRRRRMSKVQSKSDE